jgi:hypothetical protein
LQTFGNDIVGRVRIFIRSLRVGCRRLVADGFGQNFSTGATGGSGLAQVGSQAERGALRTSELEAALVLAPDVAVAVGGVGKQAVRVAINAHGVTVSYAMQSKLVIQNVIFIETYPKHYGAPIGQCGVHCRED